MNPLELIKDAAFFGGYIQNERLAECRDFFDNVIEKRCTIDGELNCCDKSLSNLPSYVEAAREAKKYAEYLGEPKNGFHELDFYNGAVWLLTLLEED